MDGVILTTVAGPAFFSDYLKQLQKAGIVDPGIVLVEEVPPKRIKDPGEG